MIKNFIKALRSAEFGKLIGIIGVLLFIVFVIVSCTTTKTLADDNNNVSGDNTLISGGYTSTSNTTYEDGSSSNTTSTTTNTTNSKTYPNVATASAPPSSSGIDVCHLGSSLGMQSSVFGLSQSSSKIDMNCVRIKLARELATTHQMKVAAIAVLCQDPIVFRSMEAAGTPCPFEGKIGRQASRLWNKYPDLRPDIEEFKRIEEVKATVKTLHDYASQNNRAR